MWLRQDGDEDCITVGGETASGATPDRNNVTSPRQGAYHNFRPDRSLPTAALSSKRQPLVVVQTLEILLHSPHPINDPHVQIRPLATPLLLLTK